MAESRSDEELIRLVQETPAEELTPEEIEQLRAQLQSSPRLQQILLTELHLENYLHTALGGVALSVDSILQQAALRPRPTHGWPLAVGLAGLLIGTGALWVALRHSDRPHEAVAAVPRIVEAEEVEEQIAPAKKKPVAAVEEGDDVASPSDALPATAELALHAPAAPDNKPSAPDNKPSAPNTPAAPQAAAIPAGPWSAALDPQRPLRSAEEIALEEPASLGPQGAFPVEELKTWLEPVAGQPHGIHDDQRQGRHFARLEGLAKLRAPWPADGVLRLALFEVEDLQIHLWNGLQGVSLRYTPHQTPRMWGAYHATREEGKPQPSRLALVTSDSGRHDLTKFGWFELRYQDGMLVMSRGGLRLLTVPLSGPPTEVIFEGKMRFSHLSLARSKPLPPEPHVERPAVLVSNQVSRLAWFTPRKVEEAIELEQLQPARESLDAWSHAVSDGVTLSGQADGGVELGAVSKTEQLAAVCTPLKTAGLYEVILRVADAQPGSGVYLGGADGQPLHRIGFSRDRKTGWTTFAPLNPSESHHETEYDPRNHLAPYAGERQWLRLVVGHRTVKLWTSPDGRHWGRAARVPIEHSAGPWSTVGLYVLPGEPARKIRLNHLEVRELSAITGMADAPLRARVELPDEGTKRTLEEWLAWTFRTRPQDVESVAWRRACAVETLAAGRSPDLARELIPALLHDTRADLSTDERLRLLEEISWIDDHRQIQHAKEYVAWYAQLGRRLEWAGEATPWRTATTGLLAAALWCESELDGTLADLAERQLLRQIATGEGPATHATTQQYRAWRVTAHPDQLAHERNIQQRSLWTWGEALAASRGAGRATGSPTPLVEAWRHPLVTHISKEGYNIIADFESAVSGRAWQDACQIIGATDAAGLLGLLPANGDDELLISLPREIARAMRQHAPLRAMMDTRFGRLGLLRVRQAMSEGRAEAIEAATVQFYGTAAAAEAHRWLGDRHLAGGRFAQALEHYRLAQEHAPLALRADAAARQRLAAAMLGETHGAPATQPLKIAGATLAPAELEKLVEELRAKHRLGQAPAAQDEALAQSARQAPPPTRYAVETRGALEGDLGHNPGRGEYQNLDWPARQLATATDGRRLFVSNRFMVTSFARDSGQAQWSQRLGGEQGEAHRWPNTPMRPLLVGDRLYVRRLTNKGVELAALQTSDGKVLWRSKAETSLATDPVYTLGKLVALVSAASQPGYLQLDVAHFQIDTGEIISQEPLIRLRDAWDGQPPCQLIAREGLLLATAGGSTICCDVFGRPQWLRRALWIPPDVDPQARGHYVSPPVLIEDRVYVALPNSHQISCLELETGRELWTRTVPHLRRLLGVVAEQVVVEAADGLWAYRATDGQRAWHFASEELLDGHLIGGPGGLCIAERVKLNPKQTGVRLVWIDIATGAPTARQWLPELNHDDALFGPLLQMGDSLFGFYGKGWKDARRTLVELKPQSGGPPTLSGDAALDAWTGAVADETKLHVAAVLPNWTLLTKQPASGERAAELQAEVRGEKQVLRTITLGRKSVRLAHRVAVPRQGAKLQLRVGHEPGKAWTLEVLADGATLVEQAIEDGTTQNAWKTVEVDLTPLAGQTVWLIAAQTCAEKQQPAHGYWKEIKIFLP